LVLSRKERQTIVIGVGTKQVEISVNRCTRGTVSLGITAPRDVRIVRGELERTISAADVGRVPRRAGRAETVPARRGYCIYYIRVSIVTTYELAGEEIKETLAAVIDEYQPQLRDAGLLVDVLLAHAPSDANGDKVGPAVQLHGYPCYATIRIVGLRDRVAGRGDAELILDGDHCDTWPEAQLRAILDHELTHLELRVSDGGHVRRDDIDRPLLRIRKHDRQFGWFDCVARRH